MAAQAYTPTGIVHTTSVDFTSRQISKPVYLVQGDITLPIIAVELNKDGQSYVVPNNADVNIRLNKKDGTYIYNPALGVDSSRTIVYFEVTEQTAVVAGEFDPEIEIVVNDTLAGSSKFKLIIERQAIQEGMIESSSEAKALIKQVGIAKGYAEDAERFAGQANAYANQAIDSADQASNSATSAAESASNSSDSAETARRYATVITDNLDSINAVADNVSSINVTANSINNVDRVSDSIASVNSVANNKTNIDTVASNINDVNNVGASITDVNTVADNISNIDSAADNIDIINAVANDIPNINTVATNSEDISAVSDDIANINSVADNKSNIDIVAAGISNVNNVGASITDVNTVADNIEDIQNAEENAQISEGYAVGEQSGSPVSSGPYFENNSKYYSNMAKQYMESARAIAFEDIDTEMSDVSENVVENKVIKSYVDQVANTKQNNIRTIDVILLATEWDANKQQEVSVANISLDNTIIAICDAVKCVEIKTDALVFQYYDNEPLENITTQVIVI